MTDDLGSQLYTGFEKHCVDLLGLLPKRQSRHCFRSAIRHLERAHALVSIDPAMAIFRGITAEEEAASGVLFCLRELQYVGAAKLKPHNHVHKHAVYPFIRVIGLFFGEIAKDKFKDYRLHIQDEDGERRLTLGFAVPGTQQYAYPIPPLNFGIKVGTSEAPPSYQAQISTFIATTGAKDVTSYLREQANTRNTVLYASADGYPEVHDLNPAFLTEKARHVMTLLQTYLLIAPYAERQPFVQDAVGAFKAMVGILEQAEPPDPSS